MTMVSDIHRELLLDSEMKVGLGGGGTAAGGAGQETGLHQKRFVNIGDGGDILGDESGQGFQADRSTGVIFDDGGQKPAIGFVQAQVVNLVKFEGFFGGGGSRC